MHTLDLAASSLIRLYSTVYTYPFRLPAKGSWTLSYDLSTYVGKYYPYVCVMKHIIANILPDRWLTALTNSKTEKPCCQYWFFDLNRAISPRIRTGWTSTNNRKSDFKFHT